MKYIRQFGIIILFSLAGEILHKLLPLSIPASIYGILLLFFALLCGIIKPEWIKETADFLILIMPMLFIPSVAGLLKVWDLIRLKWLQYLAVVILTTIIVMLAAGWATQFVLNKESERHE